MDLRRLEVFCKLMETRSFSRTGQELSLTQPTVSGHIKTLEQQIGLQLFDRHRRQVRPTRAALVLFDYAARMLELHQEAGFALERFRGRIGGGLNLGGSTIPGAYILPRLIGRFHHLYPETQFKMRLGDTLTIVEAVSKGDLELGVVGARLQRADLEYESLIVDRLVVAAPAGHALARSNRAVGLKKLLTEPFVIREEGSGTRASMLEELARHRIKAEDLNIVAEFGSTEAVRQGIKAGLGISILSHVAVFEDVRADAVSIIKVKDLNLSRQFHLVLPKHRTRSPVGEAFVEFMRHQALTAMGADMES